MEDVGKLISTIVLAITLGCIVIGFLLGLLRGRNRSILRFLIVIGCAVAAYFLEGFIIKAMMAVQIDGQTLEQMVIEMMGSELPEFAAQLTVSIVEAVLGLVLFLILFIILQLVTWAILFPILKIFVRKGIKKGPLFGAIVGVLQGVLVAFVICSPITGAVTQINTISRMKISGQTVAEVTGIPDMSTYEISPVYKIYDKSGSWLFDMLTTYTDANGNKITLKDTVQAADTSLKVVEKVDKIQESLNEIGNPESEKKDSENLRDIGNLISEMGSDIKNMSDGGKQVMNTLIEGVKEMIKPDEGGSGEGEGSGEGSGENDKITEILSNLDVEKLELESAGNAIAGIADYVDLQNGDIEEVDEDAAKKIVEGLAENAFVLDVLGDEEIISIDEEHQEDFKTVLNDSETEIDQETKDKIAKLLGITLE